MRKSDRIYALAGTVAFHVVLLLVLLFSFLRFPPEGADEWPEEPRPEIVFEEMEELYAAGEFVRTGDNMAEYVPDDVGCEQSRAYSGCRRRRQRRKGCRSCACADIKAAVAGKDRAEAQRPNERGDCRRKSPSGG